MERLSSNDIYRSLGLFVLRISRLTVISRVKPDHPKCEVQFLFKAESKQNWVKFFPFKVD